MQRLRQLLHRVLPDKILPAETQHEKRLQGLQKQHQGKPFVLDDGKLRFLYFSEKCMQSAMRLDAPDELIFGYTRDMLGFLLARPNPEHILMIGLGGGSLVKFCHRYLPQCRITVLEIDDEVIRLRQQFAVPDDDERLKIVHADAVTYLRENHIEADVVLLDGFDGDGLVHALNTAEFYADCHRALKSDGILVANLPGKTRLIAPLIGTLLARFSDKVKWCRTSDCYNLVVFASKTGPGSPDTSETCPAATLPDRYNLHLEELFKRFTYLPLAPGLATPLNNQEKLAEISRHLTTLLAKDSDIPDTYVRWKEKILNASFSQ